MSFASRYARGSFVYPSSFTEQQQFKDCLLQKIDALQIGVLIPVLEETFLIAKHQEEFSRHVKLVLPDYQQILAADSYGQRAWERFFVQEKIVGHASCVAMLFCHGAFRAKVVYNQLREYPPCFGQAVLRESLRNKSACTASTTTG